MSALVRAFQLESGRAVKGGEPHSGKLEEILGVLYRRGSHAYPRLAVPEAAFGRYLARCAADGQTKSLAALAVTDMYLACACAERVRGAVTVFERTFRPVIQRAIARVLTIPEERKDAEQRAWQRLLVSDGDELPRITQYLGHGPLERFISVVATRVAISVGRNESSEHRLRKKAIAEASGVDPERLLMKGQLRQELESAVTRGLAALKPRERLVLKLFLVSGMTLAAIGRSLGVTRQAVTKTLAHARESILAEVEQSLRDRM